MQLASSADSVVEGTAPQGTTCFNAGEQPLAITYNWADANGKNNGNLWGTTTYQNGPSFTQALGFEATFTYDSLNRLHSAADTTGGVTNWFRNFDYDQYGNMRTTSSGGIPVSGLMPQTNLYNAANQRGDSMYDAAGNQATMGGTTLTYDAENRVASVSNLPAYGGGSETYVYDGDGRRVQKAITGLGTDIYVYDIFGKLIAEYATNRPSGSPCRTCYISTDHLGSTRLVTGDSAAIIARHDYVPFGEEIPGGYASRTSEWGAIDNVNQKFTGKERDQETGLDYFGARYLSGVEGRWMTPDFINVTNARLLEPSNTLNKYVYAGNNPLKFIDPDGQDLTLFYDPSGATGHVMVLAYNQATGDSAIEAYGPAGGPSLSGEAIQLAGGNVSGVDSYKLPASADELRQTYASLTIQTTPEVAQSVITEIRKSYGDVPKVFNAVYGRNCATSCVDALKELGLTGDRTPSGLWTDLFKKYGSAEKRSWLPIINLGLTTTAPHQSTAGRARRQPQRHGSGR